MLLGCTSQAEVTVGLLVNGIEPSSFLSLKTLTVIVLKYALMQELSHKLFKSTAPDGR